MSAAKARCSSCMSTGSIVNSACSLLVDLLLPGVLDVVAGVILVVVVLGSQANFVLFHSVGLISSERPPSFERALRVQVAKLPGDLFVVVGVATLAQHVHLFAIRKPAP